MRKVDFFTNTVQIACRAFLCLLPAFCTSHTRAQEDIVKSEYSHRRYSVGDGLPENFCWDVFQDSKGYVWTATYNGFARYDGQQFRVYWQEKQTNVQNVTENREGNITALSFSYYAVLDPVADTLKIVNNPGWRLIPYVSQNMPTGYFFYESTETDRRALFQLSDTGLVHIWEHPCLYRMDDYRKPYWDRDNRKFYIPTADYVYLVNEENNSVQDSIANQSILTVFPFGKSIGALGKDGIYRYENRQFTRVYEKTFVPNPSGLQAVGDRENRLLIRDVLNLYRFDGTDLEPVFSNIAFFNILFDTENNLWASTYTGLFNLFNLQFRNFTFVDDNSIARTICADGDRIWIGSYNGHLYRFTNERIEEEIVPRSADSYFQGFSAKDGAHLFFPGGYENSSVFHFDGKKGAWLNLPMMVYSFVLPLPDHRALFGGYQGVAVYNYATETVERQLLRSDLRMPPDCATLDGSGKILIGGLTGISVMDGDSVYPMENPPDDFLTCRFLARDRNGKIWATSTNNKLFSIENGNLKHEYTFEHPVRSVHVTDDNLLIVLTLKGIHIKKPGQANFFYYDRNNGFTGEKIPQNRMAEDAKGNIWFIADKSVVRFNPNELLQKQSVPRLHVQQVMTSKDNINWIEAAQGTRVFKHNANNFRFQPIGLNYSAVDNVRYCYRLHGFQNEWSEPAKNRELTFNNLPPGDYVFEIFADAGTDDSRSEIQSLAFSIKPAFWQTSWFTVSCIAFLILASAGVTIFIQRRRNRALMEKLRAEKELNELRISSIRLKAIPHFNANILAAIEYYITNRSREDVMRILDIYSDFTYKTLSEVDKAARPLSEELAYVKMYLDLEKIRFLDKFDFQINVDEGVNKSVQLPNMILHTYCENAVKHGLMPLEKGGLLTINVTQYGETVCIDVEDNGVGRACAAQNRHLHSSKQGLSILNRQIEIYNRFNREKITRRIDDLVGETGHPAGTRFSVEIPLDFTYIN